MSILASPEPPRGGKCGPKDDSRAGCRSRWEWFRLSGEPLPEGGTDEF